MNPDRSTFIIQATTLNGSTFRPSNWAERLSGAMSTFGCDHRMSYFPCVRPLGVNGIKSVSINKIRGVDARAYEFLPGFARDNEPQVLDSAGPSAGAG